MLSTPTSCTHVRKQSHLDYCIEGWLIDQLNQAEPDFVPASLTRRDMDSSEPPERVGSPSKRQRTSETNMSSKWVERVSRLDSDATISTFTNPITLATSASRAPSPTKSIRSRMVQLNYTSPAIFFGPPGQAHNSEEGSSDSNDSSQVSEQILPTIQRARTSSLENAGLLSQPDIDTSIPLEISGLVKRLSEETANPILPRDIISRINVISPTESFREFHTSEIPHSKTPPRKLLRHISALFGLARGLYAGSYDEAAWYPLIRMILIGPPGTSSYPFVKHEEAHTRLVSSELLPLQNGKAIPTVKVDHMLQFNPEHRQICPLYKSVFQSQPSSLSLSAFSDPIASKTFTCAILEAEAPGGNFQEASYQIAIASAAILERVRLLNGDSGLIGDIRHSMPVIGWIVHGHFWTLHVSYREIDGSIVGRSIFTLLNY